MSGRTQPTAKHRAPRAAGAKPRARHGGGLRLPRWLAQRPLPAWVVVVADLLVFAVALNVFALFHHVLPRREEAVGTVSQRIASDVAAQAEPAPEVGAETPQPAAEVTQAPVEPDPVGHFAQKFADKFTGGEVVRDDASYRSGNINLTITPYEQYGVRFYVADFYLKDISCLRTGFAHDKFGRGEYEWPVDTLKRMNAIAGINGDYCGGRGDGIVLRNGTLCRNGEKLKRDLCVLYWDGTMETRSPAGFDVDAEIERGAYQIWNFGPMLLDEQGHALKEFNSDVTRRNPRTALGYFEPGHYCFVVVDGRSDVSKGISMESLAVLFETLGCARAYNMDGGKTSEMVYGSADVNVPAEGGRMSTDVIGLVEA